NLSADLTVLADEDRVIQILHNLLGNAVKYTKEGQVSVLARELQEGWIEICVRDTGIGIPLEKQQIIFDMFEQVDRGMTRSYGGMGLGLSIAKYLVERHGGQLTVRSQPAAGSEFCFTLPKGQPTQENQNEAGKEVQLNPAVL